MPLDVRRRERKKEGERSPQETWVEELKENSISVLPKKKKKEGSLQNTDSKILCAIKPRGMLVRHCSHFVHKTTTPLANLA